MRYRNTLLNRAAPRVPATRKARAPRSLRARKGRRSKGRQRGARGQNLGVGERERELVKVREEASKGEGGLARGTEGECVGEGGVEIVREREKEREFEGGW